MSMSTQPNLVFDPNDVGPDCGVDCWIAQGPRANDGSFDPGPGARVTVIDQDGEIVTGRAVGYEDNRVWVQVHLPGLVSQSA